MGTFLPRGRVQALEQLVLTDVLQPSVDDRGLWADVARRFRLLQDASFADQDEERGVEYLRQAAICSSAMLHKALGGDVARFWRCLSVDHSEEEPNATVNARLLQPFRKMTAAVNEVQGRLNISPRELLVTSALADERFATEATEHADAYVALPFDIAAPARLLTRRIEVIDFEARRLAGLQRRAVGWHTSAAELWLRLRHLAAYAYPLMPCFGVRLWQALQLFGLPTWPSMPGSRAVRPTRLPELLLEVAPSWDDADGGFELLTRGGGPIRISEMDRDLAGSPS